MPPSKYPAVRLFGPVCGDLAESAVDRLLDDSVFRQDLISFAAGRLYPDNLLYRIQVNLGNAVDALEDKEPDAMDAARDKKDL